MKELLTASMKEAMKAKDKLALTTIRAVLSSIQYAEMNNSKPPTEAECLAIIKNEVKKRKESIEFEEKANRTENIETLNLEIGILEKFLPAQMSEEKLKEIISNIVSNLDSPNIGLIMKELNKDHNGTFDGKLASSIIKDSLN